MTDAGLSHCKGLTRLRDFSLNYSQISDAGLAHLSGLTNLDRLSLWGTKVSDAGLVHLKGLTKLTSLNLYGTRVTEDGKKALQRALPCLEISLLIRRPSGRIGIVAVASQGVERVHSRCRGDVARVPHNETPRLSELVGARLGLEGRRRSKTRASVFRNVASPG